MDIDFSNMILEKFPSFAALATFIAISVVVAHEWAYFEVIGSEFQSLFTTYDYIAQLIVWIGPAFIFLLIFAGIQIAILRSGNFDEPKVAKSKVGKFLENWYLELLYGLSFVIALIFSDQANRFGLYALFALFWVRLASYILSYEGFTELRKSTTSWLIYALPAVMIASYGVGRDAAYTDLKIKRKNTRSD
jgi:hypothetical protein